MTRSFNFIGSAALMLALCSCSLSGESHKAKIYEPPQGPIATEGAAPHFDRQPACPPLHTCAR
jgi:hypothetical protein